STYF
ncbi:tRNA synthetases class I family protein, partial [Chlamydia psittaci 06-1683]